MNKPLSAKDRQHLEELFDRATELPITERQAFAVRECGSNQALRDELLRLLAADEGEDVVSRSKPSAPLQPGTSIGPYKLLEKIGEGGMGEVYAAEQLKPIARRVALKVIKLGMDSREIVARFEAERQALARMTHANVAQVYDGGTTESGSPYFVMEYVGGEPITDFCDRRKLSTRQRIELFLGVCEGVQHAHQKGLIHRDLKPSNLLVTLQDDRPVPKIIDFGIARATSGRLGEQTLYTAVGQIVGTLDYMSPEQADPTGVEVDTRSDVYSLGVVLYELISGLLPFEHKLSATSPLSELQRVIREQTPPTPSTRLKRGTGTATTIAPRHATDERSLVRQLVGDLDWICLKALEKDPARRYASASELLADLRRHLDNQPVLAGRPGALYRARKFVRRNRVSVAAAVLVLIASLAGVVGIVLAQMESRTSAMLASAAMDSERVVGFEDAASKLWPPSPDKISDMNYWLRRAHSIVDQLPHYRRLLAELREDARIVDDDKQRQLAALENVIERGEQLASGLLAKNAIVAGQGWSVPKRISFVEQWQTKMQEDGEYLRRWEEARLAIPLVQADLDSDGVKETAYPGLDLPPQFGLVPLGPDPHSGLWEFAHLMTGMAPERNDDDELILTEAMALVFVLIPGTFDPRLGIPKGPAPGCKLQPFFLSKYEMTQGQWKRLTGDNPSAYGPDSQWNDNWLSPAKPSSLLHPVEQVSWTACDKWLSRVGLSLPSEAQWNRGARGGRQTRFWSGTKAKDLDGVANICDSYFREHARENSPHHKDFRDHAAKHWPAGEHRANPFGLHEVHGNVWEWCHDGYTKEGTEGSLDVDPVAPDSSDHRRIYRGGGFRHLAGAASFDRRFFDPPSFYGSARGVRPARAIY